MLLQADELRGLNTFQGHFHKLCGVFCITQYLDLHYARDSHCTVQVRQKVTKTTKPDKHPGYTKTTVKFG